MEAQQRTPATEHRKRRRRRQFARPPLNALVQFDGELRGNEAVLPRDLASEVYRRHSLESGDSRFIAVGSWTPQSHKIEEKWWTILPVRELSTKEEEDGSPRDLIKLPTSSPASHGLLPRLEANPFGQQRKRRDCYEAHVTAVRPLELEKIYITVDGDALRKHEEVQKKFGGGFVGKGKGKGKLQESNRTSETVDDELVVAVRKALKTAIVARQGDYLPLPLPAHPITHVSLPPAQIVLCEPLAQGLPTEATKIVVNRTYAAGGPPQDRPLPVLSHSKSLTDFDITDGDMTSNEAYHSAQENGDTSDMSNGVDGRNEAESDEESDSTSSDSDEMISMTTPSIMKKSSGVSSRATATPRGYAARANGISTPGSIFSNMTSMTSRRDQLSRGKVFKAQSLQYKIPTELLHPTPLVDDDDECRVFVDIKVLVRLGCFSGDWVKVASVKSQAPGQPLDLSVLNQETSFRPAKVFGIPDIQPPVPREPNKYHNRRSSVISSSVGSTTTSNAWFPPTLFAHLKSPEQVRISVLQDSPTDRSASRSRYGVKKINSSDVPPIAQEMTLLRISTPLTTERALQSGLFASLKHHFQAKRRLVKQDDIVAVPFDAQTCRLLASAGEGHESDRDIDEMLAIASKGEGQLASPTDIAWFKIGSITAPEPLEASDMGNGKWNGVFCVEPDETRMRQNGSHQDRVPPSSSLLMQYHRQVVPQTESLSNDVYASVLPRPYMSPIGRRLKELMAAATSPRAIHLKMDPVILLLHSTQRNIGKATMAQRAANDLGLHAFTIDSYDILSESNGAGDVKAETLLKARVRRALASGAENTSLLIRHIDALTGDRLSLALEDIVKDVRVLVATTTDISQISDSVRGIFTHEFEINAPDEVEREGLLRDIIHTRRTRLSTDVDIHSLAVKTAALVAGNLVDIVTRAEIAQRSRITALASKSPTTTIHDVILSSSPNITALTTGDFTLAIDAARKSFADSIGAPKIPTVSWSDIGGLAHIKSSVQETIQLPLEHPELFSQGLKKRSGILFYGPPGTGKTLVAKAIATEYSLNFFSVKGPELLNMYIGESEANVRRVFQKARDAKPCVVFFDELDSVAPKRGNQGDSGGVMDRIVSQILAELDGMSEGGDDGATGGGVFVIGATNRPDLLDPALLRPGRFDKMLYLGVSDTHGKQKTILEALTRKFVLHPELDLGRVAESLPFTYTGADFYALCSDAMLKAITRQAEGVDEKVKVMSEKQGKKVTTAQFFDHYATKEDIAVMVMEADFEAARRELVPSVSAKELEHYKRVRAEFEGDGSNPQDRSLKSQPKTTNGQQTSPSPRAPNLKSSRQRDRVSRSSLESVANERANGKGKGKGKARRMSDSEEEDEDAYATPNDIGSPERKAVNGFGEGGDDGELYD